MKTTVKSAKLKFMKSMVPPDTHKPPTRKRNIDVRCREYLTHDEVEQLRTAAKKTGRNTLRDSVMILTMFIHGLRVSELSDLKWEQVNLEQRIIHIKRIKNGTPSTHPINRLEARELSKLKKNMCYSKSPYVFTSEIDYKLSPRAINHIIARAGRIAGFSFTVHPHMLRHATGYYLANKGEDTRAIQAYLGHADIRNTVKYTELSANRFEGFFSDN